MFKESCHLLETKHEGRAENMTRTEDVQRLFSPLFLSVVRWRRAGVLGEFSITSPPSPLLWLLLNRPGTAMQVYRSGTVPYTISLRHGVGGLQG